MTFCALGIVTPLPVVRQVGAETCGRLLFACSGSKAPLQELCGSAGGADALPCKIARPADRRGTPIIIIPKSKGANRCRNLLGSVMGLQAVPRCSPCGIFPIIHWEDGEISTVDDAELPVLLPELTEYKPGDGGQSPLANATEWLNVVDKNGRKGIRETNTMPQWAGSCWYYLRYIDACNGDAFLAKELEKYWMPVDLYVGGAEHAVLHLLYSRFWHKSVQNECRDEMLAFRHDRVQPRTPKASTCCLTWAWSPPTNPSRSSLTRA